MKESFGKALGNTIVKNLANNADVDPKRIALGLVATAAGTALTVATQSVTKKVINNALRKRSHKETVALLEQSENAPESDDNESSDKD